MAIDQNRSAAQDRDLRIPLIYRLEFPKRLIHYFKRPFVSSVAMDFVIFDAAGEDMEDPIAIEQFCQYILAATGIIFMVDAAQLPGIRNRLPEALANQMPAAQVESSEVVSRVINLFETRGRVRVGTKIKVPVAFALSKSDILKDVVHPGSRVLRDSRHIDGFDVVDCERVSEEVREFIKEWDSSHLLTLADSKFERSSFFAMSALGQSPNEELRIGRVSPIRAADPLLWILWQNGFIPAAES
ncbi:MAG: hypothetical protein MI757_09220 [Pirellulales bacterium]|nr:hypothetical protein [Pirellulales bacterium]